MYEILKALHLISMVAWFGGLLGLCLVFLSHTEHQDKPDAAAALKAVARNLYMKLATPGMVLTFVFGIAMIASSKIPLMKEPWMHCTHSSFAIRSGC